MPEDKPQTLLSAVQDLAEEHLEAESDQEFVKKIFEKKDESKRLLKDMFRLGQENIAFVEGIQHLSVGRSGATTNIQGNVAPGSFRIVDNRTFDMARRLHARLDQPTYRPTATSLTELPEDTDAARVLDSVLNDIYNRTKFSRRKRKAIWWEVVVGWFYAEPYFDSMAGPKMPVPKMGEINPLTGQAEITVTNEPAGSCDFVIRAPMTVYRDPRFNEWELMQWVIIEEVASRGDVLARFADTYKAKSGKDLDDELKDEAIDPVSYLPDISSTTTEIAGIPRKEAGGIKGAVRLLRYYERPSQKYPEGRQGILAGKKVLFRGTLKTPDSDLPPVPFGYVQRPWAHEGKSPVGEVRGLQKVVNLVLMRWIEHVRRWAAGWLLIPTTAGIPVKGWASTVASIIRYNPAGGKPEFVQPPFGNLRAYMDLKGAAEASMEERMSLPPAMRGQMPRGAKAAKMVELLQEAADQIQAPVLSDLADGFSDFWTKMAGLVIDNYSPELLLQIVGEHRRAAVTYLKSEKFRSDWRSRVLVKSEAGQPLPASRIARNQLILDLARRDLLFGPPGSVEHIRKLRDALGLEPSMVPTDNDKDATIARNENLRLRQGQRVLINEIDDDQVHINEHSDDAKALRSENEQANLQLFLQHIGEHRQQLQMKMASTMPQPPAPPGGGAVPLQKPKMQTQIGAPGMIRQPPGTESQPIIPAR